MRRTPDSAWGAPVVGSRRQVTVAPFLVCRRPGCVQPVDAPDGLCAGHERAQVALREHVGSSQGLWPAGVERLLHAIGDRSGAWRERAACRGATDVMYPADVTPGSKGRGSDYVSALAVCASCPVVDECRAAGAAERHGVWGATTPKQRFPRRSVARAARGAGRPVRATGHAESRDRVA